MASKKQLRAKGAAPKKLKSAVSWAASTSDSSLDTAVVYESVTSSQCGHAFQLDPLIDYLEKSTDNNKKTICPTCETAVELVCDGMTKTLESRRGNNEGNKAVNNNQIVTFKYRNHIYRLSVLRPSTEGLPFPLLWGVWAWQSWMEYCGESTAITAQERIAHVLNMDLHGMKILHKGKKMYPNPKQSPQDVSTQILQVCEAGGKPLVMGTRLAERQQKMITVNWISNMLFSLLRATLAKTLQIVTSIALKGKEILMPLLGGVGRPHRD